MTADAATGQISRRPAAALGTTLVLQVVAAALFTAAPVAAPALPATLGLDEAGLGVFGALTFVGAMFGSPLAASFVPRFGAIRLIQAGMLLSAAALAVLYAEVALFAFAAALLIGFGYGPNAPGGSHLLSRHTSAARRGLIFSIKQSGVPVGGAVVGLMVPAVEAAYGWRAAVAAVVLLGVAVVILVQPWRAALDGDRPGRLQGRIRLADVVPLGALREHPMLPRISLTAFAYGAGQMITFTYFVLFLTDQVGLTLLAAGAAFSTMQVTSFVTRVAAGWLNDRLKQPKLLLAAFGIVTAAGVMLLAGLGPSSPYALVLTLAALCGAGAAGWNGVYLAEVAALVPPERVAAATGATVFCTYFGLVVGPVLFSLALAWSGYDLAFGGLAALTTLGGLVLFLPTRAGPRGD